MIAGLEGWGLIFFIGVIGLFLIGGGIGSFFLMRRMLWPYKYTVLENVSGAGYVPSKRGRAKLITFGDGGEEIFFLNKLKKWRVAYGKRIGKNSICWFIGEDGYWYNNTFSDPNKKLLEMGILPVDRDMRYSNSAVRKGIENRYDDRGFMDKYGTIIAFGMLFLCIIAFGAIIWLSLNKSITVSQINADTMKTAKEVLKSIADIKGSSSGLMQT